MQLSYLETAWYFRSLLLGSVRSRSEETSGLILVHYWGNNFLSAPHAVMRTWGFSTLVGGSILACMSFRNCFLSSFWVVLPLVWQQSPHAYALISIGLKIPGGLPAGFWNFSSPTLSSLGHSASSRCLDSADLRNLLHNWGRSPGSIWVLPSELGLETLQTISLGSHKARFHLLLVLRDPCPVLSVSTVWKMLCP